MTDTNVKRWIFDHGELKECVFGDSNDNGQPEMDIENTNS